MSASTYLIVDEHSQLPTALKPTLYFIGVSTAKSSIRQVFPRWSERLELGDADLVGIDLPLHARPELYRKVVKFIRDDHLSLGALVTTHKLDLFEAAADLFDDIDPHAQAMSEISCISKRGGRLVCHAKDPVSSGHALDSFIPPGHWRDTGAEVICLGAGGSTIAISWYLTQASRGIDRPSRLTVSNRSQPRLDHIRSVHLALDVTVPTTYVLAPAAADNDRLVSALPPGSLVINATGLGKDAPGSPIGAEAVFPERGFAWELNYRGKLLFLQQALAQGPARQLHVEDGWTYFLHGWTQVIAEVFHVEIPTAGTVFEELSVLAGRSPRSS